MDFGRAFTYSFEDKEWVGKMVMTVLMVFVSIVPIFGLLATCALLGYITELARNIRNGHPRPLPKWDKFGEKATKGAYALLAILIYNLPAILISIILYTFSSVISQSLFGGFAFVVIVCCALPVLFAYTVVAWSMLAIGLIRYGETGDNGVFYRFGKIFRTLQQNYSLTLQYVLYSILSNVVLSLIGAIPCIGWIGAPALYVSVQGYLIGEYGRQLSAADVAYRKGK